MSEAANLEIRVLSTQVDQANRRLEQLEKSGSRAERATDGLTSAFSRLVGPLAAAVTAGAALSKFLEVAREFDKLNAGLITATGSAENAKTAFEALQDFATNTPYDLAQVTDSFTKLVNYGLTPSERALTSYGNTASSLGKGLNQMVEAVADAATGEFERLKEFGIRASQEGDRVTFTFRGISTTVGKSASEIEQYLIQLGENNFAGAMTNRMETLDGALSNLADEWDKLFQNISQQGVGELVESGVRVAIDALTELNAMLASGEMQQYLLAISSSWWDLGEDVQRSMTITADFVRDIFKRTGGDGKTFAGIVFETIMVLGTNTLYVLKSIGTEIGGIAAQMNALAHGDFGGFAEIGRQMKADAEAARKEVDKITADILNPKQGGGAATSEFQQHMDEAKRLREEWDKAREARLAAGQDRLATFRQAGGGGEAAPKVDKAAAKAAEREQKQRAEEFQRLVEDLRTQEEAIQASYEKRKAIIEKNTPNESEQRKDLMARLDADRETELARIQESKGRELEAIRTALLTEEEAYKESYDKRLEIIMNNTEAGSTLRQDMMSRLQGEYDSQLAQLEENKTRERDSLYNGLLTEEEMLRQSYERRKQQILESTAVTETERLDLQRRLEEQYTNEMAAAEQKRIQTQLQGASALFDGLAGLAKSYAGEQSQAYRVLFAVSKAFSVAQAAMSIATGLAKAQELGFPANLAEMARVASAGASIVAQISGANFSGAYDKGGNIPAGKIGLVGEYGPELIQGPAKVTSRAETAKMFKGGGESAASAPPVVNNRIINVLDPAIVGDYLATDAGEQLIMNVVQRNQRALG